MAVPGTPRRRLRDAREAVLKSRWREIATRDVLRRRGVKASWRVVHNIPFERCDVDHVAFGSYGVLAIETKWANTPWRVCGGSIDAGPSDPVRQAHQGARTIRLLMRGAGLDVRVVPVVVQWGPGGLAQEEWSFRWFDDGVLVRRGSRSRDWVDRLSSFTVQPLDPKQVEAIGTALEHRKAGRAGSSAPLLALSEANSPSPGVTPRALGD